MLSRRKKRKECAKASANLSSKDSYHAFASHDLRIRIFQLDERGYHSYYCYYCYCYYYRHEHYCYH